MEANYTTSKLTDKESFTHKETPPRSEDAVENDLYISTAPPIPKRGANITYQNVSFKDREALPRYKHAYGASVDIEMAPPIPKRGVNIPHPNVSFKDRERLARYQNAYDNCLHVSTAPPIPKRDVNITYAELSFKDRERLTRYQNIDDTSVYVEMTPPIPKRALPSIPKSNLPSIREETSSASEAPFHMYETIDSMHLDNSIMNRNAVEETPAPALLDAGCDNTTIAIDKVENIESSWWKWVENTVIFKMLFKFIWACLFLVSACMVSIWALKLHINIVNIAQPYNTIQLVSLAGIILQMALILWINIMVVVYGMVFLREKQLDAKYVIKLALGVFSVMLAACVVILSFRPEITKGLEVSECVYYFILAVAWPFMGKVLIYILIAPKEANKKIDSIYTWAMAIYTLALLMVLCPMIAQYPLSPQLTQMALEKSSTIRSIGR
ncbi:hypothetical protein NECID01_1839 [Nematocida sp. AWRm77]|nr:hypothetical protein NECID01_1839 [Nematocida sp. AWRm77]